jgi:hypothetical protein
VTPEQLFHGLFGLGRQRRVTRCEYAPNAGTARGELDGGVGLWIEETPELWNGEGIATGEAARPKVDWSGVVCVACDELSVRKAHHYVGVFCDLIGKCVLFATPGKDAATWGAFVTTLGEHNGQSAGDHGGLDRHGAGLHRWGARESRRADGALRRTGEKQSGEREGAPDAADSPSHLSDPGRRAGPAQTARLVPLGALDCGQTHARAVRG